VCKNSHSHQIPSTPEGKQQNEIRGETTGDRANWKLMYFIYNRRKKFDGFQQLINKPPINHYLEM
jgi:hypothetical protein